MNQNFQMTLFLYIHELYDTSNPIWRTLSPFQRSTFSTRPDE